VPHHVEALPPHLSPVLRFGQLSQVDDEGRGHVFHALVTFTERGRTTAQALLDGHRRLARQLFANLPLNVFDGFDAGLLHVITQFRGVLAAQEPR
jgi:hypothetical protein